MKMQEPDLNKMWETFIRIEPSLDFRSLIRTMLYPTILDLRQKEIIDWYCFLIHNRKGGVPTTEDDDNAYFHIRFSLKKNINPKDVLPDYCVMTRKVKPKAVADIWISQTEVMDKSKIRDEKIEKAWRIIGEQSEWFLNLLDIYKEDARITPKQVSPFLHYFANMTQLEVRF